MKNFRLLQLLRSAGAAVFLLLSCLLVFSCAGGPARGKNAVHSPEEVQGTSEKPAAEIPGPSLRESALVRLVEAPLLPEFRTVALRIFPQNARVLAAAPDGSGGTVELLPQESHNDIKWYTTNAAMVLLEAPGYQPQTLKLPLPAPGRGGQTASGNGGQALSKAAPGTAAQTAAQPADRPDSPHPYTAPAASPAADSLQAAASLPPVEAKLERQSGILSHSAEIATPWQPKSVRFAPDGNSVFTANLGSPVPLSEYRINPPEKLRNFQVPENYRSDKGFVETAILPEREEIWVSQMTRNAVHVWNYKSGRYLGTVPLSGSWPKVLLPAPDEKHIYVSCWLSNTIVEIDTESRRETRSFAVGNTPRGMVFSPDGQDILTALFDSSTVERVNVSSGTVTARYNAAPGHVCAMRHIVYNPRQREYYITAMGASRVFRLSENGEWTGWWRVGKNPNTCALSPGGRYLFVSCRGPNNPDTGYLTRGYEYGKIYIINTVENKVEGWIWGRDQCTGLDVSPNGSILAFSDFLSANLELYAIKPSNP